MTITEYLKKNLTARKFYDICDYIEELYLLEYDLLILMARKFYNLFCVFHDINKEKYANLPGYYHSSGRIVTDRCIPLIIDEIKKGKYKKIIIGDDIIIHGRTIREIYDELLELNPDIEVRINSYLRNDEDASVYEDIIEKISSRYLVQKDVWREMSDEFVNIFYMSGRPYISYLPFFSISKTAYKVLRNTEKYTLIDIQDADMKRLGVDAYLVCGDGFSAFSNRSYCQACVARIYDYTAIQKTIVVPYFCFNTLLLSEIKEASDFVRQSYCLDEYKKISDAATFSDDIRLRELEYITSSWIAYYLFDDVGLKNEDYCWNRQIEKENFFSYLLKDEHLEKEIVKTRFDLLSGKLHSCEKGIIDDNMRVLWKEYLKLEDRYKEYYSDWEKKELWNSESKNYVLRLVQNLMVINGGIDELRCRNKDAERKRLWGIPVSRLIENLTDFLMVMDDSDYSALRNKVFAALIQLVDSGRGTIVTRLITDTEKSEYGESLIYAGEQNYKFYEAANFPLMYGLYITEILLEDKKDEQEIREKKTIYTNKYTSYLSDSNIFYMKEEAQQLAAMNISDNYGTFLRNAYAKYRTNKHLQEAVNLCFEVCNDELCNRN